MWPACQSVTRVLIFLFFVIFLEKEKGLTVEKWSNDGKLPEIVNTTQYAIGSNPLSGVPPMNGRRPAVV
jgi:hypothetical protein